MMTHSTRVLITGDLEHREFSDAVRWLENHTHLIKQKCIDTALDQLSRMDTAPDVIVVAQSRPGQFSSSKIEHLHAASPLSRIVALLGSWCEGEMRTGRPWPGVTRVYWHQWPQRGARELSAGTMRSWSMPRTTSDAECVLRLSNQRESVQSGLILIDAQTTSNFDYLADICRSVGWTCRRLEPSDYRSAKNAHCVIWNRGVNEQRLSSQLRDLVRKSHPAPVLALLDFPRREDQQMAISAGAKSVISKPFLVSDILHELDRFADVGPDRVSPAA